jgi:hypothetical protein
MKDILYLMIKTLVVPFYKNHAGLLFFAFFIMFGVVESAQIVLYHQSLIYGMLSSGVFLLVVLIVWLLYQLKSLHFLIKTSNESAYQFLTHLALMPANQSISYFLLVSFLTFLPVFVYSLAIYALGIQNGFYGVLIIIFAYQALLCLMSAWVLNNSIRSRHVTSQFILPELRLPYLQTHVGIYLGYIFKEEKSAVFLSKLFSLTLLYFVKETLEAGDDFRIIGITWLFALLAHTFLVYKTKKFENHSLQWTRSLPIAPIQSFVTYFILYALLMIPELLILSGSIGRELSLANIFLLPIIASAFLIAVHTYLFKPTRDPDKFMSFLFWLFIICFLLTLSKLIWVTGAILLVISFIAFNKWAYLYERIEN